MPTELTYQELLQKVKELEAGSSDRKNENENILNLQAIYDNAQIGYHIYHLEDIEDDKTLTMISANKAAAAFTGVTVADIVGKTLDENFPGLREKGIPQIYADVVRTGKPAILETVHYSDSRVVEGAFSVKAFSLPNNCVGVTFENVTDRLKTEQALRRSEEKYRLLFETMSEGVCLHDIVYDETGKAIDYKVIDVNPAFESTTGMKKESVLGKKASELYGTGTPPYLDIYAEVAHTREPAKFEIFWPPMEKYLSISAISPAKGRFATIFTDLTSHKRIEQELRRERDRAQGYLDTVEAIIVALNEEGRITMINRKGCRIFGCSQEELIGRNWFSCCLPQPEGMENVYPFFLKLIAGDVEAAEYFENPIITRSGELRQIAWHNSLIRDDKTNNIVGTLSAGEDITERKRAEEALRESEMRFVDLSNMLPEAVFEADIDMNLTFVNQCAYSMFGYSAKDLDRGLNGFDMLIPEDRKRAQANAAKRIKGEELGLNEYHAVRKDGSIFPVLLHVAPTLAKGNIIGFKGVIVDITAHKKAQEQIQRAQKMESIGNLAGGIAHDFNNLLFPIIGMSELLMEEFSPDSPEYENAREILNAGLRGSELVKQILAFSRQSEHKILPVRVQKILKEVIRLARATIPADIEISRDIQPDCGMIMADPTQVHQIAMNLITNAYHALEPAGGKIFIELKEAFVSVDNLDLNSLQPGRYAMISVSDTGCGIDPGIVEKIFEPYFTTKGHGKGTGLGLAVAYGIVKDLQGDIKVYSELDKGSTFEVYLPLRERPSEILPVEKASDYKTGNERILLVDDEGPIVKLERQMLERLGYRVTSRTSSLDAMEAFRANPDGYDLVITDMTMPNMTGDQLARELILLKPSIRIIMCTGFSERMNSHKAASMGIKGFLMKPVVKSEMAQMIRKVLDESE